MKKQQFISILDRYLKNEASGEEQNLLHAYYHLFMADDDVLRLLKDEEKEQLKLQIKAEIDAQLAEGVSTVPVKTYKLWARAAIWVAAAIALIVLGVYFFNNEFGIPKQVQDSVVLNDIAPGKNGATLTLASGKMIKLGDAENGELAKEAGVTITKSADGKLVYEIKATDADPDKINTLSTAKGETYQLRLPDGSMVYLNAASSLTYSATLREYGKRTVRLSGEAYFEIAKDKKHPFVVRSGMQDVEVLGTHFNVSAYEEDKVVKTTLLEGRVSVRRKMDDLEDSKAVILKPNQQAEMKGGAFTVKDVDASEAVLWKEGKFSFEREEMGSIMRKVARWYNVDVVFEEPLQQVKLTGSISRFEKVSKLLEMLEYTKEVKFKVKGRTVYVHK